MLPFVLSAILGLSSHASLDGSDSKEPNALKEIITPPEILSHLAHDRNFLSPLVQDNISEYDFCTHYFQNPVGIRESVILAAKQKQLLPQDYSPNNQYINKLEVYWNSDCLKQE